MSTFFPPPEDGRHPDSAIVKRIAYLLCPEAPGAHLAKSLRRNRNTVRSWLTGHRRPPIAELEVIASRLQSRVAELGDLLAYLNEVHIPRRKREPVKLKGFMRDR